MESGPLILRCILSFGLSLGIVHADRNEIFSVGHQEDGKTILLWPRNEDVEKRGFSSLPQNFQEEKWGLPLILPNLHDQKKRGFSFIKPNFHNTENQVQLKSQDNEKNTFQEEKRGFSLILPNFQDQKKRGFSFIKPNFQNTENQDKEEKRGFSFIKPNFQNTENHVEPKTQDQEVKRGFSFIKPHYQNGENQEERETFQNRKNTEKRGFSSILPNLPILQNKDKKLLILSKPWKDLKNLGFSYPSIMKKRSTLNDLNQIKKWIAAHQSNDDKFASTVSPIKTWTGVSPVPIFNSWFGSRNYKKNQIKKWIAEYKSKDNRIASAKISPLKIWTGELPVPIFNSWFGSRNYDKRSALINTIKVRYGIGGSLKTKNTAPPPETVSVSGSNKAWWDPKNYITHPYQFNPRLTPQRITTAGKQQVIVCTREALQNFLEIDKLLSSPLAVSDSKPMEKLAKQLGEEEFDLVSASPGPHEELTEMASVYKRPIGIHK